MSFRDIAPLPVIACLFKTGRLKRGGLETDGPDEFFYGTPQLQRRGYALRLFETDELAHLAGVRSSGIVAGRVMRWLATIFRTILPGLPTTILSHLLTRPVRAKLREAGVVFATTTGLGIAAAILKRLGLLPAPLVVLAMGILPDGQPWLQRRLFRFLLRGATLATLSKPEVQFLADRLGADADISYLPFGVDADFWTPGAEGEREPAYVFAIGNDPHRDWSTLIAAWRPEFPVLKIITTLPIPAYPSNVEVLSGDWHSERFSDAAIRDYYRGAQLVVLPIRQTIQPSGQSACLQAMACGKAVVLSDIDGIWDRSVMASDENCVLVPPGNSVAIANAVTRLLADDDARKTLGLRARSTVEQSFTSDLMGEALVKIVSRLVLNVPR